MQERNAYFQGMIKSFTSTGMKRLLISLLVLTLLLPAAGLQAEEGAAEAGESARLTAGELAEEAAGELAGEQAGAGSASDLAGHWAESALLEWLEAGYISGYGSGELREVRPNRQITRAELAAIINRVFGYSARAEVTFTDVATTDWYYGALAAGAAAGYIQGYPDDTMRPNANVSRQEFAAILARLTGVADAGTLKRFSDAATIPAWAQGYISGSREAGLLGGYPDGSFRPAGLTTRAEAVVAMQKAQQLKAGNYTYSASQVYGPESGTMTLSGNVTLSADGVRLQNAVVTGDLTVAASVGEGDVFLSGVKVQGTLYVRGGGSESVHVENAELNRVEVNKPGGGTVRLAFQGSSTVGSLDVQSELKVEQEGPGAGVQFRSVTLSETLPAGSQVQLEGEVEELTVGGSDVQVELGNSRVNTLTVSERSSGATITTGSNAVVGKAVFNGPAKVQGSGQVQEAEINTDAVELEQQPQRLSVREGVQATVGGESKTSADSTPSGGGVPGGGAPGGGVPGGGAPGGGAPGGGVPGGGAPGGGTPGGGAPGGGVPGGGTPGGGTPDEGTPGGGTPDEGTPGGGTPTEPDPDQTYEVSLVVKLVNEASEANGTDQVKKVTEAAETTEATEETEEQLLITDGVLTIVPADAVDEWESALSIATINGKFLAALPAGEYIIQRYSYKQGEEYVTSLDQDYYTFTVVDEALELEVELPLLHVVQLKLQQENGAQVYDGVFHIRLAQGDMEWISVKLGALADGKFEIALAQGTYQLKEIFSTLALYRFDSFAFVVGPEGTAPVIIEQPNHNVTGHVQLARETAEDVAEGTVYFERMNVSYQEGYRLAVIDGELRGYLPDGEYRATGYSYREGEHNRSGSLHAEEIFEVSGSKELEALVVPLLYRVTLEVYNGEALQDVWGFGEVIFKVGETAYTESRSYFSSPYPIYLPVGTYTLTRLYHDDTRQWYGYNLALTVDSKDDHRLRIDLKEALKSNVTGTVAFIGDEQAAEGWIAIYNADTGRYFQSDYVIAGKFETYLPDGSYEISSFSNGTEYALVKHFFTVENGELVAQDGLDITIKRVYLRVARGAVDGEPVEEGIFVIAYPDMPGYWEYDFVNGAAEVAFALPWFEIVGFEVDGRYYYVGQVFDKSDEFDTYTYVVFSDNVSGMAVFTDESVVEQGFLYVKRTDEEVWHTLFIIDGGIYGNLEAGEYSIISYQYLHENEYRQGPAATGTFTVTEDAGVMTNLGTVTLERLYRVHVTIKDARGEVVPGGIWEHAHSGGEYITSFASGDFTVFLPAGTDHSSLVYEYIDGTRVELVGGFEVNPDDENVLELTLPPASDGADGAGELMGLTELAS